MLQTVIDYFAGPWGKVELAASIMALVCVYQAVVHNMWTWFWGALSVILFGALFYEYKLYSDAGLQLLFFLPMQVYGWWKWNEIATEEEDDKAVLTMRASRFTMILGVILVLTALHGTVMSTYTDASFPYADALTTFMSIFAQVLMSKKYIESWLLWISMDAIAIRIYYMKELYVTSSLYAIFFVLATIGLIKWYKDLKEARNGYVY